MLRKGNHLQKIYYLNRVFRLHWQLQSCFHCFLMQSFLVHPALSHRCHQLAGLSPFRLLPWISWAMERSWAGGVHGDSFAGIRGDGEPGKLPPSQLAGWCHCLGAPSQPVEAGNKTGFFTIIYYNLWVQIARGEQEGNLPQMLPVSGKQNRAEVPDTAGEMMSCLLRLWKSAGQQCVCRTGEGKRDREGTSANVRENERSISPAKAFP